MNKTKLRAVLGLSAMLAAQLAFAHAALTSSAPADQAVVDEPPRELTLRFSEPVRLTALTVTPDGEAPREIESLPGGLAEELTVTMPALDGERFVVSWRAMSQDTHVLTGELGFTVEAGRAEGGSAPVHSAP